MPTPQPIKTPPNQKMKPPEEESSSGNSGEMSLPEIILWILLAIIADIISLIPYVGLVVSWPFAAFFMFYKYSKGLNFKKTMWASVGDFLAEGIFSSLPANLADVIITIALSKGSNLAQSKIVSIAGQIGGPTTKIAVKAAQLASKAEKVSEGVGAAKKALGGGKTEQVPAGGTQKTSAEPKEGQSQTTSGEAKTGLVSAEGTRPAPPTKAEGESPFLEEAKESIEEGSSATALPQRFAPNPQPENTTQQSSRLPNTDAETTSLTSARPITGLKPPIQMQKPETPRPESNTPKPSQMPNANPEAAITSSAKPMSEIKPPIQMQKPKTPQNEVEADGNTLDLAA